MHRELVCDSVYMPLLTASTVNVTVAGLSVRLSVRLSHPCTLIMPLDGLRCHLAGTLVWPTWWLGGVTVRTLDRL